MIVIATLYGMVIYLAALLYCLIAAPDLFLMVTLCGPVIISGTVAVLVTLDAIWCAATARRRTARRIEDARAELLAREAKRSAVRDERRRVA